MADLDIQALRAKNLTPKDVTQALLDQNLIVPTGTAKVGKTEYAIQMNNSTDAIEAMNDFPIKRVGDATVFLRDVAHVHNGYQVQTNSVSRGRRARQPDDHPQDRRRVHAEDH